jgi:hypothetical protein
MINDLSPAPGLYTLHCGQRTLIDARPGLFRNRSEALRTALNILKCPNWTHDMWLRLDEPNGQSFGTDDICHMVGSLRGLKEIARID